MVLFILCLLRFVILVSMVLSVLVFLFMVVICIVRLGKMFVVCMVVCSEVLLCMVLCMVSEVLVQIMLLVVLEIVFSVFIKVMLVLKRVLKVWFQCVSVVCCNSLLNSGKDRFRCCVVSCSGRQCCYVRIVSMFIISVFSSSQGLCWFSRCVVVMMMCVGSGNLVLNCWNICLKVGIIYSMMIIVMMIVISIMVQGQVKVVCILLCKVNDFL